VTRPGEPVASRRRASFSTKVLVGLALGIATGLFFGEDVAPLQIVADGFVRLLQMTVLPYVTLSITANLGALTYARAKALAYGAGGVLLAIWAAALLFTFLVPLALPDIQNATFFSPDAHVRQEFDLLGLYVPSNPFHSLANSVVPAVVLFSVMLGLALIGVERKDALLDVLHTAIEAIGRMARSIVTLTPVGIFAIAAYAAGTLDVARLHRIEIFLVAYVAFALLLALFVLPGLIAALTPIGAREVLSANRDALLTAFLVGDLFIVLPSLIDVSSRLLAERLDADPQVASLPRSVVPTSFTFPHAGKLLSISFVLFAGWFADTPVPVTRYPELAVSGLLSFFGSLNVAIPFLLDQFRIPADTFQLFLATGVVNQRVGTLLAAVHTIAVGLLGSAAMAGRLRPDRGRLLRHAALSAGLTVLLAVGLRAGFSAFAPSAEAGRDVVMSMSPLLTTPVAQAEVADAQPDPAGAPSGEGAVLARVRGRGALRVGILDDSIPYAFANDRRQLIGFDVEMARLLGQDLEIAVEFRRLALDDLARMVGSGAVDIVMSGARATPLRAATFMLSESYLQETLAMVVADPDRDAYRSWDAIRRLGPITVGIRNVPYYRHELQRLLPNATIETLAHLDAVRPGTGTAAFALAAERGALLAMEDPRLSVVVPEGATIRMPLAYPLAGTDPSWARTINTWIDLKRSDGTIDRLYDHWIRGRAATAHRRRWSVLHDVLRWQP